MKKTITTAILASSLIFNTTVFASHDFLSDSSEYMENKSGISIKLNDDEIKKSPNALKIDKEMGEDISIYGKTLYEALSDKSFIQKYEAKKTQLAELTTDIFTDLDEIQWYSEYISLPVYFNVLNGYEDGTLKPNGQVTCAEVAKIVATAYETGITNGGGLENEDMTYKWYANAYRAVGNIFTYEKSTLMTDAYMNSPMRRCEIAYVLANACNDGTLNQYITKAQMGDLSSMAGYTDFHSVVDVSRDLESEQQLMASGKIPARFAGAIMYLKDKGIMVGDGAGHISPLNTVSRAEVFKLIQETCKATSRFGQGAFANAESIDAPSKDIVKEETQTPVQNTSTGSGVYLDGSGAFHSVNEQAGTYEGHKAGDNGIKTDSTKQLWTEMQSRKNIKVSYSDAQRPRLKAGDVFIAQDGTEYTLKDTGVYMLDGTPVMGVGLPIAMDLGRSYVVNGRVRTVTDGYRPDVDAFGRCAENTALGNLKTQTYIVFDKTGEGHWSNEWDAIQDATYPEYDGKDGEVTSNGYWKYSSQFSEWTWQVR